MKKCAFISFLLLLVLGSSMYGTVLLASKVSDMKTEQLAVIKENELRAIKVVIDENITKAQMQIDAVKDSSEKAILSAYPDQGVLKNDLSTVGDKPVYNLIQKNIDGKYLNVVNDNNDINVWTKLGKVVDTSHNCAFQLGEVVTIDGEVAKQNDKPLARIAINSFMNQENRKYIFWIYLETPADYYLPTTMEESELDKLFSLYGAEGFTYVEFLVPSYLRQNEDITGVRDVNVNGIKNDNNKIVFVQGFNVYDDLKKNHADMLQYYDDLVKSTADKYDAVHEIVIVVGILLAIVMISAFVSMVREINKKSEQVKIM